MIQLLFFVGLLLLPGAAQALTTDEIIKLKQAGVADTTIELLIAKDADQAKRSGIIRQDGWIVHTTEIHEARHSMGTNDANVYSIEAYPWTEAITGGRWERDHGRRNRR